MRKSYSIISGNTANDDGGGIYSARGGATLRLTNSNVSDNDARYSGGIYNGENSNLIIENSDVTNNQSERGVGGIVNSSGNLEISNSTISNNSSYEFNGVGGIASFGSATITSTVVTDNSGGGISASNLEIIDSTVSGNTSSSGGVAGISVDGNSVIRNSTISNNVNSNSGYYSGGVSNGGNLEIIQSTITGNSAESAGGITNTDYGNLTIVQSIVSDNTASSGSGGGINNNTFSDLEIIDSTISGNTAATNGGGIYNTDYSNLTILQSTIAGNSANSGGGVFNFGDGFDVGPGDTSISNSTITNNSAETGSGITNNRNPIEVTSTIIAGNKGDRDLAGIASFASNGHNLIGNGDGASGFTNNENNDIVGTSGNAIDPLLDTLQDNGGATPTVAILTGSPAIDAGSNPLDLATDQRGEGFDRILGNATDIGAFESEFSGNPSSEGESIIGTNKRDSLAGGAGNDTIDGSLAMDTIAGGAGNDSLFGGRGKDLIFGDEGNDEIAGNQGGDTLDGGAGNDTIFGDEGRDVLVGGAGDDVLSGGGAADRFTLALGQGTDNIIDFEPRRDKLLLSESLTFDGLSITQNNENTDLVSIDSNELIAVLVDTNANSINESDFVS